MGGRRKGNPDTRQEIMLTARELFARGGYDGTSLRAIATRAEVNVALIRYYFGTKEELFTAAVSPPIDLDAFVGTIITEPPEEWPVIMLTRLLTLMDTPLSAVVISNFRGAIREQRSSELIGRFMLEHVAKRAIAALPETVSGDREWRANVLASQIIGLIVARYIVRLEPLASASHGAVLATYVPALRRTLLDPLE